MSNNNATVAIPGHANWAVWWSPQSGFDNFQLDIVGFLAVLGEESVQANAQVSALSRLFLLPRLLPAPQALLRTTRPTTLAPSEGKVTGVYSGNVKDHVHHVANVLLGHLDIPYSVKHVRISKNVEHILAIQRTRSSWGDRYLRGAPSNNIPTSSSYGPPLVRGRDTGPMFWVTLLGVFQVIVLFTCSIVFGDGMSLLATLLLGGLSTVVGICNKWTLRLSKRIPPRSTSDAVPKDNTPKGDAVIRYPNGSYMIVECEEDVARELLFAPEEIEYDVKSEITYRLLSLLGTVLLMLGVIALANAKLQLQMGWAGAYITINIAHWIAAALPQKSHWDLDCYSVQVLEAPQPSDPSSNFTLALWKSISLTRSIAWVRPGNAAPLTPVWDTWLAEAERRVTSDDPDERTWNAKAAWDRMNAERNGVVNDGHDINDKNHLLPERPRTEREDV